MDEAAYRTHDLVLASVLWLEGFRLELELDGQRVSFVFRCQDSSSEVSRIAREVVGCKYVVEPLEFAKAMGEVRSRMYRFLEVSGMRRPRTAA